MRSKAIFMALLAFAFTATCATNDYVREEITDQMGPIPQYHIPLVPQAWPSSAKVYHWIGESN